MKVTQADLSEHEHAVLGLAGYKSIAQLHLDLALRVLRRGQTKKKRVNLQSQLLKRTIEYRSSNSSPTA